MSRTDTEPGAGSRLAYLDNLKTWLIAGIIVGHGLNSYTDFGSWPYQDVQDVMVSELTETAFAIVASLFTLFLMGLFFLISGLFTAGSFERKGARRFVADRLLRLGVPFAAFTLLLWPLLMYAVREPFLHEGDVWYWFVHSDPFLDNGPIAAEEPTERVRLAGPVCTNDSLAEGVATPRLEPGDLVAVLDQGAYCEAVTSDYCAIPIPAAVLASGGRAEVTRRREGVQDVAARFGVPSWLTPGDAPGG